MEGSATAGFPGCLRPGLVFSFSNAVFVLACQGIPDRIMTQLQRQVTRLRGTNLRNSRLSCNSHLEPNDSSPQSFLTATGSRRNQSEALRKLENCYRSQSHELRGVLCLPLSVPQLNSTPDYPDATTPVHQHIPVLIQSGVMDDQPAWRRPHCRS